MGGHRGAGAGDRVGVEQIAPEKLIQGISQWDKGL